ncbi:MBL fold metallo-hydrolase [Kineococcus sp. SYSU DK003]|uniref:MBL fold metallo-hydrolase n=1 Tax=Kineococcus sp. SYSU DK003 TaxID=3383124 RepID=UPI003D7D82A0
MKITQVRNATLLLEVGGHRIVVDPMLGAKGSMDPFPAASGNTSRNPTVDLVVPLADLLDPDVVVVTHTHGDHWDTAAAALLPRGVTLLVQNQADAEEISAAGFQDVRILDGTVTVGQTSFTLTGGRHGAEEVLSALPVLGEVSGVVVRHPGEPTLYIAGDTVWNEKVQAALAEHQPDVVVLNTGEARVGPGFAILMGDQDVLTVHEAAPAARIVAVHMEALNHCTVTRAQVRDLARERGLGEQVLVPEDGETLTF